MLEVKPAALVSVVIVVRHGHPEVAEIATKPSPAPLQKRSLGGCTIRYAPVALPYNVVTGC